MMSVSNEERLSCHCSKTKCVQCHCMCFRSHYFHSDNCMCFGCLNTELNEAYVEQQVELVLEKNPHAFGPKVPVVEEATLMSCVVQAPQQVFAQSSDGDERLHHVKGCSCQEVKCSNINCECFKFMVRCTEKCKCEGCANNFGIKGSGFVIEPEQTDTSGITSEAIQMENRTQAEDTRVLIQTNAQESGLESMILHHPEDDGHFLPICICKHNQGLVFHVMKSRSTVGTSCS